MSKIKLSERKAALIQLKGNQCSSANCPLPNNGEGLDPCIFDFHHRDPTTKKFGLRVSLLIRHSWRDILLEAEKCDLLCCYCHRLLHKTEELKEFLRKEKITIDGVTKTAKCWCYDYGVNYHTFKARVYIRGWTPKRALETPLTETITIVIGEEEKTIEQWCAEIGLTVESYYRRLKQGLTPEQAIVQPKCPGKKTNGLWPGEKIITIDAVTKPLAQWRKEAGITAVQFERRTKNGADPKQALFGKYKPSGPKVVEIGGISSTVTKHLKRLGLSKGTYDARRARGISVVEALTLPKRPGKRLMAASLDAKSS